MNFTQLQSNGKNGKDAYQECDPIQVISCDQNPRKQGQYTNYYPMTITGPSGPVQVSLSGKSPIEPGTHDMVCSVNDHPSYGRLLTFKRKPREFNAGSAASSGRDPEIQQRITWNSAVNNACALSANKEWNYEGIISIANTIYGIILDGPKSVAPPQAPPQAPTQAQPPAYDGGDELPF